MSLLEKVNSPADIKNLTVDDLQQLCKELRSYIVECCAENPGHIGASLGAVEIAVAIHKVFDTPLDKVVWDVGHQAYAHKIITGRREAFKQNRKAGGISGFPKRDESEYDSFGTGHSSTSISAALGLATAAKMQGSKEKVVAVIGDGAMTGGLAFEGLNNGGESDTDLLVILNDNQISIDENRGALHNHLVHISTSTHYNKLKKSVWDSIGSKPFRRFIQKSVKNLKRMLIKTSETGSLFDSLGFRYFGPIDGNDIGQMVRTLSRLQGLPGPKLLHVITQKGKGYAPAERNQTIWHAPGAFDPITGERKKSTNTRSKFQEVFGETLLELAQNNEKIVGITPAMASGCSMNIMMEKMPERVFDVGIAESHAVTFSAALAAGGLLPFCNIYSTFSQRAYDNIIHDIALQHLKVVICLDRGGLVGEDGATHHGVFDMAAYRSVPNLIVAAPLNELELRNMLYSTTLPEWGATIIRYPRGCGNGTQWKGIPFSKVEIGKSQLLREGKDIALLSIGACGDSASKAAAMAAEKGISVHHIDMRFIKPIDKEALKDVCSRFEKVLTVEDGTIIGGLHGAVAEFVVENGYGCKVTPLGIPDRFIGQGTPTELYQECGFDADSILRKIVDEMKSQKK